MAAFNGKRVSGIISTVNLNTATGIATPLSTVATSSAGFNTMAVKTVGTYTGALSLQVSTTGTNWVTVGGTPFRNVNTGTTLVNITSALQSEFQIDISAFNYVRITALAAVTGSVTVTMYLSPGASMVSLSQALPAGAAAIGSVTATMTSTTIAAPAAAIAGVSLAKVLSAASTNSTLVLTGVRRVVGWNLYNTTAAWKYVKFFNKATAPTVGTDSPLFQIGIPPNDKSDVNGALPIPFTLGLGYGITNLSPDLDNTNVAVGDVIGVIHYV